MAPSIARVLLSYFFNLRKLAGWTQERRPPLRAGHGPPSISLDDGVDAALLADFKCHVEAILRHIFLVLEGESCLATR